MYLYWRLNFVLKNCINHFKSMSHLDESYLLSEYDHPTNYITNFHFFNSYKSSILQRRCSSGLGEAEGEAERLRREVPIKYLQSKKTVGQVWNMKVESKSTFWAHLFQFLYNLRSCEVHRPHDFQQNLLLLFSK